MDNFIKPPKKQSKVNWRRIFDITLTVIVCGIIAALGYFYTVNVRKSYLKGVQDGMGISNVQGLMDAVNK